MSKRVLMQVGQLVGVMLLSTYFLYQAYEIYNHKDKWASSFYSAYGNFEEYWNKHFKKNLMRELQVSMPKQKELYPYKLKAAMIMGYLYGFGSLLLWTGEKWATVILIVPHIIQTVLVNSPSAQMKLGSFNN